MVLKKLHEKLKKRPHWSKIGFILAAIGSAIGLGNIWRFPYIVGENGGGAFLIPYFIAVLFFGIPVMLLEFAAGRRFKGSVLTAFSRINKKIKYLGLIPIAVSLLILSYYLVITGWTFSFFVMSAVEYMSFESFTNSLYPLYAFFGVVVFVALIANLGVKKGIEKTCEYLLPLLFISILILVVKSLTLPNAMEGIKFYLTPDLSALSNPKIWLIAFGQAFFSLSVGSGIMLTYGSYLGKKEDLTKSAFTIAGADTLIAVLAGFIIFPIVFSFGFAPASGPELSFVALPQIFSVMAFGKVFGSLFFLILFIGAITSAISITEVSVTSLIDDFSFKRKKATILVSALIAIIGLPSALSYSGFDITLFGKPFLDSMDFIFGSLFLSLTALIICVVVVWFWKPNDLLKEINAGSRMNVPSFIIPLCKYIIPLALIVMFLFEIFNRI